MMIRLANSQDRQQLLELWRRSVRDSHWFVAEEDLIAMTPQVKNYVESSETEFWLACEDEKRVVGFMGLSGTSLESLFLLPDYQRRGIGRRLVEHAQSLHAALEVEVNEQNQSALAFYLKCGFLIRGRQELDHQLRPYPLLQLSWSRNPDSK